MTRNDEKAALWPSPHAPFRNLNDGIRDRVLSGCSQLSVVAGGSEGQVVMVETEVVAGTARVLIVEDHAVLADGLAAALAEEGFDVSVVAGPSEEAIIQAAADAHVDVVLLDLTLGDAIGLSLPMIEPLRETGAEVLVLTGSTDPVLLGQSLEAGACGVVGKTAAFDVVLERIVNAIRHERAMPVAERDTLLAAVRERRANDRDRLAPFEALTPREQALLAEVMEGSSAEQIAESSFVSTAPGRSQIRAVLAKLSVHSQVAAVARAHRAGWRADKSP